MSTENILADIPTDQLVPKLLQELAACVEKLEKRGETVEQQNFSLNECQAISSPENHVANTTQPSATSSASEGSEAEDGGFLLQGMWRSARELMRLYRDSIWIPPRVVQGRTLGEHQRQGKCPITGWSSSFHRSTRIGHCSHTSRWSFSLQKFLIIKSFARSEFSHCGWWSDP